MSRPPQPPPGAEVPKDPMRIFDRRRHALKRTRAAAGYGAYSFLKRAAAEDIALRLSTINRRFDRVLDLGAHDGTLERILKGDSTLGGRIGDVFSTDLSPASARPPLGAVADEEALPFADASFDLIVSALSLHWVNDLPGTLVQIRRALKP